MSWLNLNQSLNSLKGQITNFATEVLSEGVSEESGDNAIGSDERYKELEERCRQQELEIQELRKKEEFLVQQNDVSIFNLLFTYWVENYEGTIRRQFT
ncbi:unnamed protein product [Plutella xylostella]|uniref:(diamondback moth) hypothetical protein n=1 Tax=Plutella xylostella TaxID=51655 RepID=A0A8S4G1S4_PLUXY|nr:unnamed protein product [Plutella xylostella]